MIEATPEPATSWQFGGAGFVPYYRLCHVRRGRLARTEELEADDDVAAVREARLAVEDDPAELWCGDRKVTSFNGALP